MNKRRRSLWPRTLRAQLGLLLALFWLVPFLALGGYTVLIYRQNVAANLRGTMDNRLHSAAYLTNEKIAGVINASREISYDNTLETLSRDYLALIQAPPEEDEPAEAGAPTWQEQLTAAQEALAISCTDYLNNQFALNSDLSLAVLVLDATPDAPYYIQRQDGNLYGYYATFIARPAQQMSQSLGNQVGFIVNNEHLYLVRTLRTTDNTQSFGRLVLGLNTDSLFQFLLDAVPEQGTFYVQLNDMALTLNSPEYEYLSPPTLSPMDAGVTETFNYVTFSGWFTNREYSLGYQVPMPTGYLYSSFNRYNQVLAAIAFVALLFFFIVFRSFQGRFARPLESLSSAAWALRNGDLGVHAQAPRDDEIGELVQSFNDMSDQMQNLFNRVYREQLALKDARIIALQSQINPHFFNNTLELMNWKARMLGDEQLSDMIQALSTLLDSAMDRRNTRYVPLKNELDVANAYLTIITARFGRRMQLERIIDEDRLDSPVPRMILQPILENAVVHGLEPVGGGRLILQVVSRGANLDISVINDGKPLSEEDLARIDQLLTQPIDPADPRSQRLGIRNVNERLTLIYGDVAGLRFSMDEEGRTHCSFTVPPPPPDQEQEARP